MGMAALAASLILLLPYKLQEDTGLKADKDQKDRKHQKDQKDQKEGKRWVEEAG